MATKKPPIPPPNRGWTYDPRIHNYRNMDTGRIASKDDVVLWAWQVSDKSADAAADLAGRLVNGTLSLPEWQRAMREDIKREYIRQYLAGRGGVNAMTQREYGILGQMLRDQWRYMDGFSADIAAGRYGDPGEMNLAQIQARARLYIHAGHEAFERGKLEAMGLPQMPAYPADGSAICLTNDRCLWNIKEATNGWNAVWRLEPTAEHCETCLDRAMAWNPLFVPKGMTVMQQKKWRADALAKASGASGTPVLFSAHGHQRPENHACNCENNNK